MKQSKGFTLLEILFVIAILATMAVLGLAAYEQKVTNRRIEKTALEMQIWLQASLRYYSQNSAWPKKAEVLIQDNYMSQNDLANPWDPNPNDKSSPYQFVVSKTSDKNNPKVIIKTTIPAFIKNADKIALMVAGRLPFGTPRQGDAPTNVVQIEMPAPPTLLKKSQTIIQDVKTIPCTSTNGSEVTCTPNTIKKFACPMGYKADVNASLVGYRGYGYENGNLHAVGEVNTGVVYNKVTNEWDLKINVESGPHSKPFYGSGSMLVISTCEENSQANKTVQNNSHYIF